jgi:hypothetical protein
MSERGFIIPEIILIAGTRVALGAGLGLLIAGKLSSDTRKGAGWARLAVGALTSIPLALVWSGSLRLPKNEQISATAISEH